LIDKFERTFSGLQGVLRRHSQSLIFLTSFYLLSILAIQPLLTTDFTCGYDNVFHMWRAVELGHCLRQGYLYPRFAPDMAHGYGFLLFNFVSPGSAYIAALLNLLGLSWPLAINTTFVLGMLLGGLFAFILARDLFGPVAGPVAAVAYLFAPFQAYDVFNRGGLSESFAWAFPPLVLWAVHRWSTRAERRFLLLAALSLAGFIFTHNLFAFLFAPLLAGWVLLEGYLARDWRVIGRGALAGLLGLSLCAFFWLPGLAERGWVQTNRLLGTWVFDYRNNFLDLSQLLAPPRVVDPTLINDWPPKSLGLLPALIALLPLVRWRWLHRSTRYRAGLLLASTAGFAFLTLPVSRLLWDHLPLLPYVQFPWRFLGPAAFCSALLAGIAVAPRTTNLRPISNTQYPIAHCPTPPLKGPPLKGPPLKGGLQPPSVHCPIVLAAIIIIALLVLGNLGWFYPRRCPPAKDTSIAGMIAWERATDTLGATAKGEYLPIWTHTMPEDPALDATYGAGGPIVRMPPESLPEGAHVLHADYGPVDATIVLDTPAPFRARYLAFYYPGWRVIVDGNPVPISPTDPDGLVSFDVPAGRHTIRVRFDETTLRLTADALSILSLVALFALIIRPRITSHVSRLLHSISPILCGITLLTILLLTAFALNLNPYLRGPDEWRWAYAVPSDPARLWIPALTLSLYLILTLIWIKQATRRPPSSSRWQRRVLLLALVLAVPLIQASLLAIGDRDILRPLFYRTVSAGASGVFSVGSTIEDAADFLRRYPTLMPTFPVHPQRYPPGLPLLFYLARRILETFPSLNDLLGFRLRLYQCHDLTLMRLSNATISTAIIQMALPLLSGFTLLPLYGLARQAYGQRTAAWAVALYPLVPSFALWSARWEQFYPFLASLSWYLLYLGLTRTRRSALLAAGLTLSLASLLNFGNLALLLPMALFALFWLRTQPSVTSNLQSLISNLLAFLVGLTSPWLIYQFAFGTGFLDIWRVSMSYHLGLDRGYWTWLGYHLYDFFVFLGLPLALLFLIALVKATRDLLQPITCRSPLAARRRYSRHPQSAIDTLTLSFALGLLLLDLSGTSRGEVARVWLFLTPFAVISAARGLTRLRLGRPGLVLVTFLMALQLFTFNTFLRVVTTGLTDPPFRARHFDVDQDNTLPPITHPLSARFSVENADSIALLGYNLDPDASVDTVDTGDTLHLTLYWQSLKPMTQPYTVFTHLVGSDEQLAGHQDNMPLRDTGPTTCWVPGEIIADPYDIPINPQAPSGDYVLETGFYLWETGERLPASGPAATPDHRIILTHILIGER